ncbi:glycosyltransferase family 39 protein [Candidatus Desantisbacteria bacterium]|nr:glycosyltransferase family 39 protein [Candidatus Desantisbacteria bacterium]
MIKEKILILWENERKFLITIFFLSLILKLLYIFMVEGINTHPGVDGVFYDKVALNVARGYGFVTSPGDYGTEKPPIYVFLIGLLYYIFGHNYGAIRIVQAILSGVICIFTYLIGKKVKNENIGKIASFLVALDPFLTQLSAWYLSQILYITFEIIAIYFIVKMEEEFSWGKAFITGLLLGLSSLTMSYSSPFFYPFILLWSFLVFKGNAKNIGKSFGTIALVLTLTISVWTIRNYIIFKEFIPIGTASGLRFWGGNNPRAKGVWVPWSGSSRFYFSAGEPGWGDAGDWSDWASQAGSPWLNLQFGKSGGLTRNERDMRYWLMGWKWIKKHPADYLILSCKKFITFWQYWNPLTTLPRPNRLWRNIGKMYYYPLLVFFLIGIIYNLSAWKKLTTLYIFILHSITGALVFFGDAGQRAPITPVLWIIAAAGLAEIYPGIKEKLWRL